MHKLSTPPFPPPPNIYMFKTNIWQQLKWTPKCWRCLYCSSRSRFRRFVSKGESGKWSNGYGKHQTIPSMFKLLKQATNEYPPAPPNYPAPPLPCKYCRKRPKRRRPDLATRPVGSPRLHAPSKKPLAPPAVASNPTSYYYRSRTEKAGADAAAAVAAAVAVVVVAAVAAVFAVAAAIAAAVAAAAAAAAAPLSPWLMMLPPPGLRHPWKEAPNPPPHPQHHYRRKRRRFRRRRRHCSRPRRPAAGGSGNTSPRWALFDSRHGGKGWGVAEREKGEWGVGGGSIRTKKNSLKKKHETCPS